MVRQELSAIVRRGLEPAAQCWLWREAVEADIVKILRPRWLDRVISTTLVGDTPADLRLTWRTKPAARAALEADIFGKRILFTDHDDRARPIRRPRCRLSRR